MKTKQKNQEKKMKNEIKNILKIGIVVLVILISSIVTTSYIGISQEQLIVSNSNEFSSSGIVRYCPESEASITGSVRVCPSAGVGGISSTCPPESEVAGIDIQLGECDQEEVLTIHQLNEYSNFFMDLTFDMDHAHHIVVDQGEALSDIGLMSVTSVQANTRTIGANFMFQSGGHTDAWVYDQCCDHHSQFDCFAIGQGVTTQFVEISVPFYVIKSGHVEINVDLATLGAFEEKSVVGEWYITHTGYSGCYQIDGNDVIFDQQSGPIVARGPEDPYVLIATFYIYSFLMDVEAYCECGPSCFASDDGITNDNFNINIDFLE